ncbi:MAG: helix-turn-helix domain-containing protein [Acidobacteria bacterium]|nr:helix-turn-helix domain-containing protein [Acidobacteriota bacterium]
MADIAGALSKHLKISHFPPLSAIEHVHDRPLLLWADAPLMVHTRAGAWAVPRGRMVWLTAWTRFRLQAEVPVHAEALLLDPVRARAVTRASAVLGDDEVLEAIVRHATRQTALEAGTPGDRRLFAVLLDRIEVARGLPLLVRAPLKGRLASVVELGAHVAEGRVPSVADLALSMGTSRKTVERAFARDVGLTAGRWRQQVRLTRAAALLSGGRRVADVAREIGYRSPSAFVAAFRKAMGTTPRRFAGSPGHGYRPRPGDGQT